MKAHNILQMNGEPSMKQSAHNKHWHMFFGKLTPVFTNTVRGQTEQSVSLFVMSVEPLGPLIVVTSETESSEYKNPLSVDFVATLD